jgi:hypothetical protein
MSRSNYDQVPTVHKGMADALVKSFFSRVPSSSTPADPELAFIHGNLMDVHKHLVQLLPMMSPAYVAAPLQEKLDTVVSTWFFRSPLWLILLFQTSLPRFVELASRFQDRPASTEREVTHIILHLAKWFKVPGPSIEILSEVRLSRSSP